MSEEIKGLIPTEIKSQLVNNFVQSTVFVDHTDFSDAMVNNMRAMACWSGFDLCEKVFINEVIPNLKAKARAEVIEEVRNSILEVIKERTNAGLDDMEGADYKEFLQAEFFVVAMGIVKDEVIKALTKLIEVEK